SGGVCQGGDGIRDWSVTGVQTCALPIYTNVWRAMRISAIGLKARQNLIIFPEGSLSCDGELQAFKKGAAILAHELRIPIVPVARSEERRVGKEGRMRWSGGP